MTHWSILLSPKWWDQDKYEKLFITNPEVRSLYQSKGRANMKKCPLPGDTFIIEYRKQGVMKGKVILGFHDDPSSEKHRHSCNIGSSPHSTETQVALLLVEKIIPIDKREDMPYKGQRTWISISEE